MTIPTCICDIGNRNCPLQRGMVWLPELLEHGAVTSFQRLLYPHWRNCGNILSSVTILASKTRSSVQGLSHAITDPTFSSACIGIFQAGGRGGMGVAAQPRLKFCELDLARGCPHLIHEVVLPVENGQPPKPAFAGACTHVFAHLDRTNPLHQLSWSHAAAQA